LLQPLVLPARVPLLAPVTVKLLPSSSPVIVSVPPAPSIVPAMLPALAKVKLSFALPPIRVSMLLQPFPMPVALPLPAPVMAKAVAVV